MKRGTARSIVIAPAEVLTTPARSIDPTAPATRELAFDMAETMRINDGVGLAAPQVNESVRLAVIRNGQKPLFLINPEIVQASVETHGDWERCLSIPQRRVFVVRPVRVVVRAQSLRAQWFYLDRSGIWARVIQHELDHLDGKLITDFIPKAAPVAEIGAT